MQSDNFACLTNICVAEVERQLKSKASTPQLPSKKQRNGSSSSAKHQHQVSDPSSNRTAQDQDQPMLSTFGSRSTQHTPTSDLLGGGAQGLLSTKSTVVQLRRNTNKMGRQAPTPPKRTSSFRDSTYTDADQMQDESGDFNNGEYNDTFPSLLCSSVKGTTLMCAIQALSSLLK